MFLQYKLNYNLCPLKQRVRPNGIKICQFSESHIYNISEMKKGTYLLASTHSGIWIYRYGVVTTETLGR